MPLTLYRDDLGEENDGWVHEPYENYTHYETLLLKNVIPDFVQPATPYEITQNYSGALYSFAYYLYIFTQ